MKNNLLLLVLLLFSSFVYSQKEKVENNHVNFDVIDKVPVYPGCRGKDNISLKKCMSKKVIKYVTKNYNTTIIHNANLRQGKHKILVSFIINKNGKTTNIKAKGSIPELEIEAIRVVNSLPLMEPGIHNGEKVNVIYSMPILFQTAM